MYDTPATNQKCHPNPDVRKNAVMRKQPQRTSTAENINCKYSSMRLSL